MKRGSLRDHVSVSSIVTEIDLLALDRLHETLGFAVVVWIAAATHRTDQAVLGKYPAIGLGGVLRTAIGMMDAAARWLSGLDRGSQCRQSESRIDLPTERIANHPARPGVQNHRQVDEAGRDADVRDIADPELIGAGWAEATGKVGKDRTIVVAVRGAHELAQGSHLEAVLAHQSRDRLVIDDHSLGAELVGDAPVAVAWELGTQRLNAVAQNLFLRRTAAAAVIVSRARQLHDSASPRDGDGFGPLTME